MNFEGSEKMYTASDFEDMQKDIDNEKKNLLNPRIKYVLTPREFDIIGKMFRYWAIQPEFDFEHNGAFNSFQDTKNYYIKWTYDYLKQFWPNVEYQVLDYKMSFKVEVRTMLKITDDTMPLPEMLYDTVAFKFAKGRPEIYLLIDGEPKVLDEMRFDAYDEGKFVRPKWKMEEN